jgi:hypothetical protein
MALTLGQYSIDLGSGTEAQKPSGAEAQLRWNTTNRSLDQYTNNANGSDNFFSAVGGRELIYRYAQGSSWSSLTLDWGINNSRFSRYEVTGVLADPDGTAMLYMRLLRASNGNVDSGSRYGHTQNWRCSNDGQDIADGNRRIDSNPLDYFPLSNYNDGNNYRSQANGEQQHMFSFETAALPCAGSHNQTSYWARGAYQSPNGHYGFTQVGIWNQETGNAVTGTNGQAFQGIRGVQLLWSGGSNRSVSGLSSCIMCYGIGGTEERTL